MHDVKFLEKQWFKLKFKSLLFKISIIALIVVVLSIALSFFYVKVIDFSGLKSFIELKKEEPKKEIPTPSPTPIIEEEPAPIYKNIIEEEKIIDSKIKNKPETQIVSISKTERDFLTILKDKFSKNPTYVTAISIAEEYFKNSNYIEALSWSIKANEIDDKKDDSWLIFAKSKDKLNKGAEAIHALKIYLSKNQSNRVEDLLNKLVKSNEANIPKPTIAAIVEEKIDSVKETSKKEVFEKRESKSDILTKIKIVKKAYYAYPNAKDALTLAKSYVEVENYKNCIFWAEKLMELLPNSEAGYIYYGTCAPKERFYTKSIKVLRGYLKKEPNNEKIKSLIEKIKLQKVSE